MSEGRKNLSSGALAKLVEVSPDTIRHYERIGVLPKSSRTPVGYRIYGPDAVERVRIVRRALQLGFSLPELGEIFRLHDRGDIPCGKVLDLTEEKLSSVQQEIKKLQQTEDYLKQILRDWRRRMTQTAAGSRASLLHSLPDKSAVQHTNKRKHL